MYTSIQFLVKFAHASDFWACAHAHLPCVLGNIESAVASGFGDKFASLIGQTTVGTARRFGDDEGVVAALFAGGNMPCETRRKIS